MSVVEGQLRTPWAKTWKLVGNDAWFFVESPYDCRGRGSRIVTSLVRKLLKENKATISEVIAAEHGYAGAIGGPHYRLVFRKGDK